MEKEMRIRKGVDGIVFPGKNIKFLVGGDTEFKMEKHLFGEEEVLRVYWDGKYVGTFYENEDMMEDYE